jgi:hypothetical protein
MRYMMILAGAAMVLATPAFAEDWDFILFNDSGKEIKLIEVSPAGTATWQANKVEEGVKVDPMKAMGPGVDTKKTRTTVHFDKGDSCSYDVRATFADDTTAVWSGANVCKTYSILRYKAGAPVVVSSDDAPR